MNNSIKSGFKKQDEMTDGFFQSEITIIGATPASGKSAFIASCIDDICFNRKIPAMLFSLEMGKETISRKLEKINDKSIEAINENRLIIDDTPNIKINELCKKAIDAYERNGIKIIFIDYLGLIATDKQDNPISEQMAEVLDKLKALASELKIPIVIVEQLRRSANGGLPNLESFRTSAVKDVADVVILLHRERENAIAIVAKNSHGNLGEVSMIFDREIVSLKEVE